VLLLLLVTFIPVTGAENALIEPLVGVHSKGKLLASSTNIKLGVDETDGKKYARACLIRLL
jgi:hypothetical protein